MLKSLRLFRLIALSSFVLNTSVLGVSLKPMAIEPGLWKSQTEMKGGFIEKALANIPESQRAMVKEMLKSKMEAQNPITEACFTKEMVNNPQKAYEEQMAKQQSGCKIVVKESSSTKFVGTVECQENKLSSTFTWKVIDKKTTETYLNARGPGGIDQKIKVISKWVQSKCTPKSLQGK